MLSVMLPNEHTAIICRSVYLTLELPGSSISLIPNSFFLQLSKRQPMFPWETKDTRLAARKLDFKSTKLSMHL